MNVQALTHSRQTTHPPIKRTSITKNTKTVPIAKPSNDRKLTSTTIITANNEVLPHINNKNNQRAQVVTQQATLRWEYELEDAKEENERIENYKNDRRKRYLAARKISHTDWMESYHSEFKTFIEDKNATESDTANNSMVESFHQILPDVVTSSVIPSPTTDISNSARTITPQHVQ